jgi:hypothetical protein
MFWIIWKKTAMPVTPLVSRRSRWMTWFKGPRSDLGFNATSMRPWLAVLLGPPTPTVELT